VDCKSKASFCFFFFFFFWMKKHIQHKHDLSSNKFSKQCNFHLEYIHNSSTYIHKITINYNFSFTDIFSGRELHIDVDHILMQLSAQENFIAFCCCESFQTIFHDLLMALSMAALALRKPTSAITAAVFSDIINV
jgi:hypothetical protein